jgi:alpha-tubulin suppressor-like RCC1 family protein
VNVSAGVGHACAVDNVGDAVCWGDNSFGQCAAPAGVSFDAIAAGDSHTCGLTTGGSLLCWGDPTSLVVLGVP